jgi:hypothetical protein
MPYKRAFFAPLLFGQCLGLPCESEHPMQQDVVVGMPRTALKRRARSMALPIAPTPQSCGRTLSACQSTVPEINLEMIPAEKGGDGGIAAGDGQNEWRTLNDPPGLGSPGVYSEQSIRPYIRYKFVRPQLGMLWAVQRRCGHIRWYWQFYSCRLPLSTKLRSRYKVSSDRRLPSGRQQDIASSRRYRCNSARLCGVCISFQVSWERFVASTQFMLSGAGNDRRRRWL